MRTRFIGWPNEKCEHRGQHESAGRHAQHEETVIHQEAEAAEQWMARRTLVLVDPQGFRDDAGIDEVLFGAYGVTGHGLTGMMCAVSRPAELAAWKKFFGEQERTLKPKRLGK